MDLTFLSLIILSFLILYSILWFVSKTLKEGRKALGEISKDSK